MLNVDSSFIVSRKSCDKEEYYLEETHRGLLPRKTSMILVVIGTRIMFFLGSKPLWINR